jgi:hypothetical protein
MGTRALTRIYDERDNLIVSIYRQSDGHPDGHGAELKKVISSLRLVNGLGDEKNVANGMGDLAAQIVCGLKMVGGNIEPGEIYLCPSDEDTSWAEFVYDVRQNKPGYSERDDPRHVVVKVTRRFLNWVLYEGPVSDFDPNMKY